MKQIKELMCKIEKIKTFIRYENILYKEDIYSSFNILYNKIKKQEALNNNDRFILINFPLLLTPIYFFKYFKENKVYFNFDRVSENKNAIVVDYQKYSDNKNLIQPDQKVFNIFKQLLESGFTSHFSVFYNFVESKCIERDINIDCLLQFYFEDDIIHQSIYYGYECARYSDLFNQGEIEKDDLLEPNDYDKFKFLNIILKEYKKNLNEEELLKLKNEINNYFDSIELRDHDGYNYSQPPYSDFKIEFINIEDLFLFLQKNKYI